MKAVKQIIDYLRGRGCLTNEQLVELASGGFLRWEDVYGEEGEEAAQPEETRTEVPVLEEEGYLTSYPMRQERERKSRDVVHKGPVLEAPELASRLRAQFETWNEELSGLVHLARRVEPCANWGEAAVVIRNAPLGKLYRALTAGLEDGEPPLNGLWESLKLERYREILHEPGLHGPAPSAYQAILAINEHAHLGKLAWLLKEEEVAQVFNLRMAQRRVLEASEGVFRRRPKRISTAIRQQYHWLAYWAFVLLYTARRGKPGDRPLSTEEEHRPPRGQPDEAGWMAAWAHAVVMDRQSVTPFLFEHNRLQETRATAVASALSRVLASLSSNGRQAQTLYYRRGLSEPEIAKELGWQEANIIQELSRLRESFSRELSNEPTMHLPFHSEPPFTRDAFVDECLRNPDQGLKDVINRYFGPSADMLCPRHWD